MSESPESVVQRQLEAYNAHDIDAFMATYSQTIQLLEFPSGKLISEGQETMRARYADVFIKRKPHVDVAPRIVSGNFVIDREKVTISGSDEFFAVAIYEVVDGLIQRVWFVEE
jgi:hypothetical protein